MAKLFPNGRRRGADTRNTGTRGGGGGKSDIICDGWAPECCVTARPTLSLMRTKVAQSERNAEPGEIPVVLVKKKYEDDVKTLVIMSLGTLRRYFLPEPTAEPEAPECEASTPGPPAQHLPE